MSCCGQREKGPPERKQRWEFMQLDDFRATSFWTYLAYGWLWFMGGVGIAVYTLDTFTAVNLLAFDRFNSQVQPKIPFKYSKWIFAGCIFLSWALLVYEWIRALRVVKRDGVAASYMDPIAMSIQSMRKKGFKRFLVYGELTKSKKGTDYVAFFVYFAFQSAVRVCLAEGPRQAVNALTLYAVMEARLINGGVTSDGRSQFEQFFVNLSSIADHDLEQAMIYFSMLFTLVIWVFSALCLICAGILYLAFLWHYIPQRDGRLRIYCRRKIDRRLEKIVAHWVEEAIQYEAKKRAEQELKLEKAEKKAELKRQKTGELPPPPAPGITRAPTLPDLGEIAMSKKEDGILLGRQDTKSTVATLPVYSSRPPTSHDVDRQPSLPNLGEDRPPMPSRSGTGWSKASFESDVALLPNAGFSGADSRVPSPAPTYYSRQPSNGPFNTAAPGRMNTHSTQRSLDTPTSASSRRPPPEQRFPVRSNTGFSFDDPQSAVNEFSPIDGRGVNPMPLLPVTTNTAAGWNREPRRQDSNVSYFSRSTAAPTPPPQMARMPTMDSLNPPLRNPTSSNSTTPAHLPRKSSFSRPFTPAPAYTPNTPMAPTSYEMARHPPLPSSTPATAAIYQPFNPGAHQHNPSRSLSTPIQDGPRRNVAMVNGVPPPALGDGAADDYFSLQPPRTFTDPAGVSGDRVHSSYGSILDEYGAVTPAEQSDAAPVVMPSGHDNFVAAQPQQSHSQFRAYTPGSERREW